MTDTPTSVKDPVARQTHRDRRTRRVAGRIAVTAALALLAAVAVPALAPRPALANHDSVYTVCPEPVPEGDSARMGIGRSGFRVLRAFAYTDNRGYTADTNDYTEYYGVKFEQSEGLTLWFPILTTADDRPEHDETFAIGFWSGGVWHPCVVTIVDDDAPRIIDVDIVSTPMAGWVYRDGESIDVTVTFDSPVDVNPSLLLALFIGQDGDFTWRGARYLRGSGTSELLFRYLVRTGDYDADGLTVGSAASNEDGTPAYGFSEGITARGTDVPVEYAHAGTRPSWRHSVDGRPYVRTTNTVSVPEAGRQTYRVNEVIEFAFEFNTRVVVQGDVCVDLFLGEGGNTDANERQASYRSGSGTDTLTFGYTVQPGDMDSEGIRLGLGSREAGICGSGTITAEGTQVQANPGYMGTSSQIQHKVDTSPPAAGAVSIVSRPADGEAYAAGETIGVEVAFDEDVITSGAAYVELNIGETIRRAVLNPDKSALDKLVFEYEVRSGDTDTDGVGIDANSLRTAGGSIEDDAGNTADVSHAAVTADAAHRVAG